MGVQDLEFLQFLEDSDLEGQPIKPIEKKVLLKAIQKLQNSRNVPSSVLDLKSNSSVFSIIHDM